MITDDEAKQRIEVARVASCVDLLLRAVRDSVGDRVPIEAAGGAYHVFSLDERFEKKDATAGLSVVEDEYEFLHDVPETEDEVYEPVLLLDKVAALLRYLAWYVDVRPHVPFRETKGTIEPLDVAHLRLICHRLFREVARQLAPEVPLLGEASEYLTYPQRVRFDVDAILSLPSPDIGDVRADYAVVTAYADQPEAADMGRTLEAAASVCRYVAYLSLKTE